MDRVVQLACALLGAPIGLVSILGDEQLAFRAIVGLGQTAVPSDVSVTRLLVSMGPEAIMVVENALQDERVANHLLVTGDPHLRSYIGATVSTRDGTPVGSLAVMDTSPRGAISADELQSLKRLARMAGDIYDDTLRHRAQTEQLEKLQLVETLGGVGHWRLEPATGRLCWSDEAFRIHGFEPAAVAPSMAEVAHLYHPEDQVLIHRLLSEGASTGATYRLRILRQDGERVTQSQARIERDEDGGVTAIFGIIQDITEREREHAALKQSEANYRLLAENLGDIVARIQRSGRIEYASPASISLMGRPPQQLIGRSARHFVHPDDWAAVRQVTFNGLAGEKSQRIEHRVIHQDGHSIWVESHCQSVACKEGSGNELVLTVRDISERKALQDQWLEAKLRAEAADRAKSEFLANMSHELRTPLTSVVGFSGVLLGSPRLSAQDRQHAERIATASDALLGVINDILDYSKLEAGAVELDQTVFDPRILAEGAAAIIDDQCERKGVAMVLEVAPDLPPFLHGDVGKIRQLVINFLANAAKFTDRGQVKLSVGGASTPTGWMLRVAVEDSGIGIPEHKIEQLFERFVQADASTTRVYGGTGLGLAICQRLVALMGGRIGAENRPEGGSRFWFEAPLSIASDRRQALERAPLEIPTGTRILLADDAAPNRELVSVILGSLGLLVDAVCDGSEALEAVRTGEYDLVLMDVHMPVMDGMAATRAIRALGDERALTPVIALTANVLPEQIARCDEAGMDAHVGKPIQVSELARVIATCLAQAPDERADQRASNSSRSSQQSGPGIQRDNAR